MTAALGTRLETPNVAAGRPDARKTTAYRADIEGLRAVAVTLVVLFHVGLGASGGYVGVDVFFVLSGFLITGLLLRELRSTGTISLSGFYARRIRRLLPLSALVLTTTAAASYFLTPALDRPGVGSDIRAAALGIANWTFAGAATQYMAETDKSPVLHYWSLAVEEQFYVLWPLLILLVVGSSGLALRAWKVARRRVIAILVVVGLLSFALSATTSLSPGPYAFFGLHTRAWELAAGAGLAIAGTPFRWRGTLPAKTAGWVGMALILGSALLINADTDFPGTAALYPVVGTVLVVSSGGVNTRGSLVRLLSHPLLRYVGRLSFAWYLWHWPCIVLIGGLSRSAGTMATDPSSSGPASNSWWLNGGAVVLSLLLSVASHHLLENPVRRSRWLAKVRLRSLALGALITAVSIFASSALAEPPPEPPAAVLVAGISVTGISVESARQARSDLAVVPRGCYQGLETAPVPADCLFGDPNGSKTIVLAGDSNARHWFPAFDKLAKERGWKLYFWGKSRCPLVSGPIWLANRRAPYEGCALWREKVLEQLKTLPAVDSVVLARGRATASVLMIDAEPRAIPSQMELTWEKAAIRTVDALDALTKHVVIMRPIPQPPIDVPACIAEDPETAARRCSFPRAEAVAPDPLDRAEDAVAASHLSVSLLDLNDAICPADPCQVANDASQIVYLNQNHLTAGYTASIWSTVAAGLDKVVS